MVAKRPTLTVLIMMCSGGRGRSPLGSGRSGQYWGAVFLMTNKVTILPSRTLM